MKTLKLLGAMAATFVATQATATDKFTIDENTLILRGEVNTQSVSKLIHQIYTSKQETITIFIDSPGGSVVDGMQLISVLQNLDKPTVCLVNFAASMAFAITQACTTRVVSEAAVMMQHQMSLGYEGTLAKGEEMMKFGRQLANRSNKLQADRIGMTAREFDLRTMNDWWLYGEQAVKNNVADKTGNFVCSKEIVGKTTTEKMQVFMFTLDVVYSGCPLVYAPLEVKPSFAGEGDKKKEEKAKSLLSDKMLHMKALRENKLE